MLDTKMALQAADRFKQVFIDVFDAARPIWPLVCERVDSDRESEPYAILGASPGMREWLGDRVLHESRAADYRLVNRHYEGSKLLDKDKIDDDVHGFLDQEVTSLAVEASYHPDELLYSLLTSGTTETIWDGQPFFSASHTWGQSGAQSNLLTTTGVATPANPTAGELKGSYNAVRLRLLSYKNDFGKFLNRNSTRQSDLLIFCPPEQEQAWGEALTTTTFGFSSGFGGNDNFVLDRPTILSSVQLTDPTKYYVFSLAPGLRPFVFQNRQPLMVSTSGENDRFVKHIKFGVDARYTMGYLAWWRAISVQLAV